ASHAPRSPSREPKWWRMSAALTPASAATVRSGAATPSAAKRRTAARRMRARAVSSPPTAWAEPIFNRLNTCSAAVKGSASESSAQCCHRLEGRRLERRVGPGEQADDTAEGGRAGDQAEVEDGRPLLDHADPHDGEGAQRGPDEPAEQADGHRLGDELGGDLPAAGAQRPPQADLPHPLHDAQQRDVGDPEPTDEQGHPAEREEDRVDVALDVL